MHTQKFVQRWLIAFSLFVSFLIPASVWPTAGPAVSMRIPAVYR